MQIGAKNVQKRVCEVYAFQMSLHFFIRPLLVGYVVHTQFTPTSPPPLAKLQMMDQKFLWQ